MHAGPVYHSCFFEGPLYHSSTQIPPYNWTKPRRETQSFETFFDTKSFMQTRFWLSPILLRIVNWEENRQTNRK